MQSVGTFKQNILFHVLILSKHFLSRRSEYLSEPRNWCIYNCLSTGRNLQVSAKSLEEHRFRYEWAPSTDEDHRMKAICVMTHWSSLFETRVFTTANLCVYETHQINGQSTPRYGEPTVPLFQILLFACIGGCHGGPWEAGGTRIPRRYDHLCKACVLEVWWGLRWPVLRADRPICTPCAFLAPAIWHAVFMDLKTITVCMLQKQGAGSYSI